MRTVLDRLAQGQETEVDCVKSLIEMGTQIHQRFHKTYSCRCKLRA